MTIHPTAVVDPGAELAEDVQIGPYAVIQDAVSIGPGTRIMAHAYIDRFTRIGSNCRIFPSAAIGAIPQDLKFGGEKTEVIIGDNVTIREFVTVHRGTEGGGGRTMVGDHSLLMAYVHVAHDCQVGSHVIIANNLAMSGHVVIEDHVGIGGMVAIHQFVRIGQYAYIGGFSRVIKDVPPYMLATGGDDFKLYGPNLIGLKRQGFPPETIRILKEAYRGIFRGRRPLKEALVETAAEYADVPEVQTLIRFIQQSERGVPR